MEVWLKRECVTSSKRIWEIRISRQTVLLSKGIDSEVLIMRKKTHGIMRNLTEKWIKIEKCIIPSRESWCENVDERIIEF